MSLKSNFAFGNKNPKEYALGNNPKKRRPGYAHLRKRWISVAATLFLAATVSIIAGPAEAATLTFPASADAVVKRDTPTTNYGTATGLKADNSPVEMSFLKFTVSGAGTNVTAAKLRLFVADPSNLGGQFRRVLNNSWTESTINFNNAPVAETTVVASRGAVTINTFVEIDVFSVVRGDGTYSFRINNTSSDGVIYSSKETSDATRRPQLILTTGTEPPPPP
ncbi:DNRLRE domain-containing protein, partial [Arthrobacter sp. Bi83]|uniref:CBM96 family carbohydrate-binding protein n=1 Tax=Arthrobacter sp. Bi83 TaxID=2822353 RepID=UPI001E2FD216